MTTRLVVRNVEPMTSKRDQMADSSSLRILLVDDDEQVRRTAGRVLRATGFVVIEALDPEDAMSIGARQRIDLLVSYVLMPGMNGFELAHRLRSVQPDMKVLFISGTESDTPAGDRLLPKPFTPANLEAAARAALGR